MGSFGDGGVLARFLDDEGLEGGGALLNPYKLKYAELELGEELGMGARAPPRPRRGRATWAGLVCEKGSTLSRKQTNYLFGMRWWWSENG